MAVAALRGHFFLFPAHLAGLGPIGIRDLFEIITQYGAQGN